MNKKKYISLICIVVVLFLAIVMAKNCFSYKIPNNAMGVRSVVAKGNIDTLLLGSSGYRKGIDMETIAEELPGTSFMLTYNGNEPFNMLIELEEMLKEDVHIGTLIVDFNPGMFDRGADLSDKRLLWDISLDGKIKLWRGISKESTTDFFTFYDYWVLANNDYMVTYPVSYPLISSRYSFGGSTAEDETEGLTKEEIEELDIDEKPGINELQRESIGAIIDICNENKINLIFMESPRYIRMEDDPNYSAKSAEMEEYITGKGVTVIHSKDIGFDNSNPAYYSDNVHMSGDGRRELTARIIDMMK